MNAISENATAIKPHCPDGQNMTVELLRLLEYLLPRVGDDALLEALTHSPVVAEAVLDFLTAPNSGAAE